MEIGLVTQSKIRNRTYYQAASPQRLLDLEKEHLFALEKMLPEFLEMFGSSSQRVRTQYFEGPQQVKNIIREELQCHKEALYIWTGKDILEVIGGEKFMADIDRQRIQKGISVKTIRFREKDVSYPLSSHGTKYLRQIRFAPKGINVPMAMGIYDTGKVGFFSTKQEGFGILVESKELQQTMTVFHRLMWEKSREAKPGEG